MEAEKWLDAYIGEWKGKRGEEEGLVARAACQMYEATGRETYLTFAEDYARQAAGADPAAGMVLFLLLARNGDGVREAIEAQRSAFSDDSPALRELPFLMAYETKCGKKERYARLVERFAEEGRSLTPDRRGAYLAALIDTIEQTSMEIYERYRALVDLFRGAARECLADGETGAPAVYALLKACRLGVLLAEKYADDALALADRLLEEEPRDAAEAGVLLMVCAQRRLLLRER